MEAFLTLQLILYCFCKTAGIVPRCPLCLLSWPFNDVHNFFIVPFSEALARDCAQFSTYIVHYRELECVCRTFPVYTCIFLLHCSFCFGLFGESIPTLAMAFSREFFQWILLFLVFEIIRVISSGLNLMFFSAQMKVGKIFMIVAGT